MPRKPKPTGAKALGPKLIGTESYPVPHPSTYPYLVTKVAAFFQIKHLPDKPREELLADALERSVRLKLRSCVVFGPKDCVYVEPDGTQKESDQPPSGGCVTGGIFRITRDGVDTGEVID